MTEERAGQLDADCDLRRWLLDRMFVEGFTWNPMVPRHDVTLHLDWNLGSGGRALYRTYAVVRAPHG